LALGAQATDIRGLFVREDFSSEALVWRLASAVPQV
jgi:hypothetical protein